jgi:hypothetical protein
LIENRKRLDLEIDLPSGDWIGVETSLVPACISGAEKFGLRAWMKGAGAAGARTYIARRCSAGVPVLNFN